MDTANRHLPGSPSGIYHRTYRVADHTFSINVDEDIKSWPHIAWHYDPFVAEGKDEFTIRISRGHTDTSDKEAVFIDKATVEGQMSLSIYADGDGYLFELTQPFNDEANAWLRVDHDMTLATLIIDEANKSMRAGWHIASATSGLMLAFMLATTKSHTLMAHAAAVVNNGSAYLFIGKSGTGKSTHTQLWLNNIHDVMHLNDDHPIVRIDGDRATAYGSPWSGKNDVYHAECAPIGGIVRLRQAPHNSIRRLSPIEAYASLTSSFSGMTCRPDLADARHSSVESLVRLVPCYQLDCLPDDDAAKVCHQTVTKQQH